MTHEQKMEEAIRRAHEKGQISHEVLNQLPSVQQLVIGIVIAGGVLAGLGVAAGALASTGVGAVIEGIAAAIVLALAAVGVITSATQIIAGIKTLMKFYEATRVAQTHEDLEAAGKDFATGIAEVGVGTLIMILSVLGTRQGLKMGKGAINRWNARKSLSEEEIKSGRTTTSAQPGATEAQTTARATVDPRKFSDYVFKEHATHGKDAIFRRQGYGKEDSSSLAKIYEQQAQKKFATKDYELGKAHKYGQRLTIEIELPTKSVTGESIFIKSGWMLREDGSISLTTPFTGFAR